jgi:hypothetical protein
VEILGVAFCGSCARQQKVYFAIGELADEEAQNFRSEALAEELERMRRDAWDVREALQERFTMGTWAYTRTSLLHSGAANTEKPFPPQPLLLGRRNKIAQSSYLHRFLCNQEQL